VIDFDRVADLPRIKAPTLVICARDDFLTPAYFSRELAQRIPGAKLMVLEKGGHAVSQVDPVAFDRAVLNFLTPGGTTG
jgi:aminoacrylate hydrolase